MQENKIYRATHRCCDDFLKLWRGGRCERENHRDRKTQASGSFPQIISSHKKIFQPIKWTLPTVLTTALSCYSSPLPVFSPLILNGALAQAADLCSLRGGIK